MKPLLRYLLVWFDMYILSQAIDIMIRYKKLVAEDNCKSRVYISHNYREMERMDQQNDKVIGEVW